MKSQKVLKNSALGIVAYCLTTGTSFLVRGIFMRYLPMEYLGFNAFFSNVLMIISIVELGLSAAAIFNFYAPLVNKDYSTIRYILTKFSRYYKIVSLLTAIIGVAVSFFVHLFITDTTASRQYIQMIFLFFLVESIFNYVAADKRALLYADQRNYAINLAEAGSRVLQTIIQIVFLILAPNFTIYIAIQVAFRLVQNLFVWWYTNRHYAFLKDVPMPEHPEELQEKIKADVKVLSIERVIGVLNYNCDNIFISKFLSITTAGIYSNYALITLSLQKLTSQFFSAMESALGNFLAEGSEGRSRIFNVYHYISFVFASVTSIGTFALADRFVRLWSGGDFYIDRLSLLLAVTVSYIYLIRQNIWQYYKTSGYFKPLIRTSWIEMALHVVLSLILVNVIGLPGILLANLLSYMVCWVLQARFMVGEVLGQSVAMYWGKNLLYAGLATVQGLICVGIDRLPLFQQPSWWAFLLEGVLVLCVCGILSVLPLIRTEECREVLRILRQLLPFGKKTNKPEE